MYMDRPYKWAAYNAWEPPATGISAKAGPVFKLQSLRLRGPKNPSHSGIYNLGNPLR